MTSSSKSLYTSDTEIRNLEFELDSLGDMLEYNWRKLFELIPRQITDIDKAPGTYRTLYNGAQEEELENLAARENLSRARLLLDEWGSWGRRGERPTLGHLLKLLTKNKMFYEADHIADLLGEPRPERPHSGPAAQIDVEQVLVVKLEKELDGLPYPDSTAFLSLTLEENLDHPTPEKATKVLELSSIVPDSIIEGSLPYIISNSDNNDQSVSTVGERPLISELLAEAGPSGLNVAPVLSSSGNPLSSTSDDVSDDSSSTIIRSGNTTEQINGIGHQFAEPLNCPKQNDIAVSNGDNNAQSAQLLEETESSESNIIPMVSLLGNALPSTSDSVTDESSSTTISSRNTTRDELPIVLEQYESNRYIPDFSILRQGNSGPSTGSSALSRSSNRAVVQQQSNGSIDSDLIQFSSYISSLISFNYSFLKTVTANFDPQSFTNRNLSLPDGRILGAGGFGEVFLALNLSPEVSVAAVKRLFPSNYKYREKFDLERDILSRYNHRNIVRLIGYSEDECLCLVYEYLPDGTLERAMNSSRVNQLLLPAAMRLGYLCGIASAIEYLHSRQVIHRDVTLANILLQGSTAKLCDFGLVKRVGSVTATHVSGTGPYLAPEALRASVTSALDVYSFGVVLAEVVTGQSVLVRDNGEDLLERVMKEGADLGAMVDGKVRSEEIDRWVEAGRTLLELANRCFRERIQRPKAQEVLDRLVIVRDETLI